MAVVFREGAGVGVLRVWSAILDAVSQMKKHNFRESSFGKPEQASRLFAA